jgi:hypothetical protein
MRLDEVELGRRVIIAQYQEDTDPLRAIGLRCAVSSGMAPADLVRAYGSSGSAR